ADTGGVDRQGALVDHVGFRADASGVGIAHTAGGLVRPDQSVSLAAPGKSGVDFAGSVDIAFYRIRAQAAPVADEPNLDGRGDRCYGDAVVGSGNVATVMSKAEGAKVKLSFGETIRKAWKPYLRLYGYAVPYKWRFALGLAFGISYGLVNSLLPLTVFQVSNFVFHGAAPNPKAVIMRHEILNVGPKIDSIVWICLAIPLVMAIRSLCSYGNVYYMNWVSNKVVNDVRNQLFAKVMNHSMDFFNRMQSGFLM